MSKITKKLKSGRSIDIAEMSLDQMDEAKQQFAPEDTRLRPGETIVDLTERLASMEQKLTPVVDKLEEGEGKTPTEITIHPAMV